MPWLENSRCYRSSVGFQCSARACAAQYGFFPWKLHFVIAIRHFRAVIVLSQVNGHLSFHFLHFKHSSKCIFFTWQCTLLSELKKCSDKLCKSVFDGSSKRFHIKCFLKYSLPTSPVKYVSVPKKCTSIILWIFKVCTLVFFLKVFSKGSFRVNLYLRY